MIHERAYAKVNLVLHVGRPRPDGLHPVCSIFASLDLADEVRARPAGSDTDRVECPGVDGPNLAHAALAAFRQKVPTLPPLEVRIEKRIPVAAGLGGGSADAAAVLRAANETAGRPLEPDALRQIAAPLGSDVPSQVQPRHALVRGTGELVEPIELPPLPAVFVPQPQGLATAEVYTQLDRMEGWREPLDPDRLRRLAANPGELVDALENDLQAAALALRPELAGVLEQLRDAGALGAQVSGAGPTCFGLFADRTAADGATATIPGAFTASLRGS